MPKRTNHAEGQRTRVTGGKGRLRHSFRLKEMGAVGTTRSWTGLKDAVLKDAAPTTGKA